MASATTENTRKMSKIALSKRFNNIKYQLNQQEEVARNFVIN